MQANPVPGAGTRATLEAIGRFNGAFGRHDVDGVMRAMTEDCVFENTSTPPDGERYMGPGPRGGRHRAPRVRRIRVTSGGCR